MYSKHVGSTATRVYHSTEFLISRQICGTYDLSDFLGRSRRENEPSEAEQKNRLGYSQYQYEMIYRKEGVIVLSVNVSRDIIDIHETIRRRVACV